jgi:hypothetical protein
VPRSEFAFKRTARTADNLQLDLVFLNRCGSVKKMGEQGARESDARKDARTRLAWPERGPDRRDPASSFRGGPADTLSLRFPAPFTGQPLLPVPALATVLLAHVAAVGVSTSPLRTVLR